mgnify:CR=1 FL=1
MALKGERQFFAETAKYRLDEIKERGYFLMLDSSNEGYAKVVDTDVTATINVLGCLLHDMIADESTSRPANYQKAFEVWKGGKVPIMEAGRIKTDVTHGTIAVDDKAYVNQSGVLVNAASGDGYTYREVGVFESTADSDGYVDVRFDCRK